MVDVLGRGLARRLEGSADERMPLCRRKKRRCCSGCSAKGAVVGRHIRHKLSGDGKAGAHGRSPGLHCTALHFLPATTPRCLSIITTRTRNVMVMDVFLPLSPRPYPPFPRLPRRARRAALPQPPLSSSVRTLNPGHSRAQCAAVRQRQTIPTTPRSLPPESSLSFPPAPTTSFSAVQTSAVPRRLKRCRTGIGPPPIDSADRISKLRTTDGLFYCSCRKGHAGLSAASRQWRLTLPEIVRRPNHLVWNARGGSTASFRRVRFACSNGQ